LKKYLNLLRVGDWAKNIFLFSPLFFGGQLLNPEKLKLACLGFFCFSFVASSIYIFNDFKDREFDRIHPQKYKRPLASGSIRDVEAGVYFSLLSVCGILTGFLLNPEFGIILSSYFLLNLLYSQWLKHFPVIDISCIAIGFVLRVFAGGVLTGIVVSNWLAIMTLLLSLFLALGKRRDDILIMEKSGNKMRKAIHGYNLNLINKTMIIMSGILILCFIVYTTSHETLLRLHKSYLWVSSLFVVTGMLRYFHITFINNNSTSPTDILFKDRFTQVNLFSWMLIIFYILYL
jgi:decaprenyl-phosphate phosphoribosyltransferase